MNTMRLILLLTSLIITTTANDARAETTPIALYYCCGFGTEVYCNQIKAEGSPPQCGYREFKKRYGITQKALIPGFDIWQQREMRKDSTCYEAVVVIDPDTVKAWKK